MSELWERVRSLKGVEVARCNVWDIFSNLYLSKVTQDQELLEKLRVGLFRTFHGTNVGFSRRINGVGNVCYDDTNIYIGGYIKDSETLEPLTPIPIDSPEGRGLIFLSSLHEQSTSSETLRAITCKREGNPLGYLEEILRAHEGISLVEDEDGWKIELNVKSRGAYLLDEESCNKIAKRYRENCLLTELGNNQTTTQLSESLINILRVYPTWIDHTGVCYGDIKIRKTGLRGKSSSGLWVGNSKRNTLLSGVGRALVYFMEREGKSISEKELTTEIGTQNANAELIKLIKLVNGESQIFEIIKISRESGFDYSLVRKRDVKILGREEAIAMIKGQR